MSVSQKIPVDWKVKNLDSGDVFLPQYPITEDGLKVSVGGTLSEQDRFGFQDPITQWTKGKARVITFTSIMFASDISESVIGYYSAMERLVLKDETLGRPPVCTFTLGSGSLFSETVVMESIDPVVGPINRDGEPRTITLSMSMRRYKPFSQTQLDATKPTKESYYLVVRSIEASYEQIARRYYGYPLAGDRLRKRHPSMPFAPSVGSKISVPARAIILGEPVEPAFHALSVTNEEALQNFQDILDVRNKRQAII